MAGCQEVETVYGKAGRKWERLSSKGEKQFSGQEGLERIWRRSWWPAAKRQSDNQHCLMIRGRGLFDDRRERTF